MIIVHVHCVSKAVFRTAVVRKEVSDALTNALLNCNSVAVPCTVHLSDVFNTHDDISSLATTTTTTTTSIKRDNDDHFHFNTPKLPVP